MISFKAYVNEHTALKLPVHADLDAKFKGHKSFNHGPNHKGYVADKTNVTVDDVAKIAKKHGFRSSGSPMKMSHATVHTFKKDGGPFSEHHLSVYTKDGKTAWHVETSVSKDNS